MLVLLDTAILTNFARVGLTQVMTDLWGEQVCTTVDALHEYRTGISAAGDDKPARRAAQHDGIQLMGTIGILRTCVKHGLVSNSEAQTFLDKMIAAGYYSPVLKLDSD